MSKNHPEIEKIIVCIHCQLSNRLAKGAAQVACPVACPPEEHNSHLLDYISPTVDLANPTGRQACSISPQAHFYVTHGTIATTKSDHFGVLASLPRPPIVYSLAAMNRRDTTRSQLTTDLLFGISLLRRNCCCCHQYVSTLLASGCDPARRRMMS